ncbi:MAG: hypothetical protein ISR65_07900 [Bacteriovoracaceae bacterium]|nr:hypothetical protein [Bacteriovoracaceae bacterium]
MKNYLLISILILICTNVFANTDKGSGLFVPVVNNEANVPDAQKGEVVYDWNENKFYGYNGTSWVDFGGGSGSQNIVIYSAHITFSSGTPSVNTELGGDWIDSLTDNATGNTTVTFKTGAFNGTDVPNCTVSSANHAITFNVALNTYGTGSIRVYSANSTETALLDVEFMIICHGVN